MRAVALHVRRFDGKWVRDTSVGRRAPVIATVYVRRLFCMMTDAAEHREKTESDLIPQPNGRGALKPPWKPGIPSPNPKGRPPLKRLTDAFIKLLDESDNEAEFVRAWFEMIVKDHDSAALREALARIEGHVPKDTQRELPTITLNVQSATQHVHQSQPVTPSRPPSPALHVEEVRASGTVKLNGFKDPDADEDEEEADDE